MTRDSFKNDPQFPRRLRPARYRQTIARITEKMTNPVDLWLAAGMMRSLERAKIGEERAKEQRAARQAATDAQQSKAAEERF